MSVPKIEGYHFGEIVIDGKSYRSDVIIYPDRVQSNWWRIEGHSLALADLEGVLAAQPDVLVVGQGANGLMQVPQATRQRVARAGIRLLAEPTEQACRTYNRLRQGEQKVVAALHLTC
jgi:hypothetical protein